MKDFWNRYGGPLLVGFGVLALVIVLVFVFQWMAQLVSLGDGSLPLLAIGGVVVLIFMLTAVAMIFSILGLANKDQAMGLPEGSIRAVIALSLIVLFTLLSVFLYQNISSNGNLNTIKNMSDVERAQFIKDHASARDIQAVIVKDDKDQPVVAKDAKGKPLKGADGQPKYFYDVTYRSANPAGEDFAKQLLVLLGTLMTAITSFYLGAGTAVSAATAGQAAVSAKPTLSGITPTSFAITGGTLKLDVAGTDLNVFTNVKIVRGGVHIAGTHVSSNANHVFCDLDVSTATAGTWDVIVDDGGAKSASLPGALRLT